MILYTYKQGGKYYMEKRNYTVCRDNIYMGTVINISKEYHYEEKQTLSCDSLSQPDFDPRDYYYRTMFFVLDENKLSNDLLYRTPSYPVLNVTDDIDNLNTDENSIVISDSYSLSPFLEYLGYGEEITYEDIIEIRNIILDESFDIEAFGVEKKTNAYVPHKEEGPVKALRRI